MRKLLMVITILASGLAGVAQNNMTAVEDVNAFIALVKDKMTQVSSIQSDFTQVKHMSIMKKDMESVGKFYYSKADKVCLSYEHPSKSKIVINGDQLLLEMSGVKSVRNISSNALMQEMVNVISSCMTGNLQELQANYQLTYLQDATHYLVKVSPKAASAKKMIETVELTLLKSDLSVESMKMIESVRNKSVGADYTEYRFSNKKWNAAIPASTFNVK